MPKVETPKSPLVCQENTRSVKEHAPDAVSKHSYSIQPIFHAIPSTGKP
jgi:hypothetical protein